jgi:uncharacterized hydrophobic protein (TIGR00271 family)
MNFLQKIVDIRSSSDPQRAINAISEGVSIRGYNMWLLFCSAVLASIGLDTSSTAVVIGAMLISPLMSPILGIGLAFGIHDNTLFLRSLKNFGAAVVLSLIASVLYFFISPFAHPTPEIEARTYPTLLDVLIALFGGIAGIVSASRAGSSIAIPGVAIATALMPPLCTAGYGLATGQWRYFAGAFYLFFINAVFISLATYWIVKYLHFPKTVFATKRQRNVYFLIYSLIAVLVTAPSVYFLYTVYQKQTVNDKLNALVLGPIRAQGNEILKWDLADKDTAIWIKVYHSGAPISDSLQMVIAQQLASNKLENYVLKPARVNMTKEEVNELSAEVSRQMFQQLQLELLEQEKANPPPDTLSYTQLNREVNAAFPFVDSLYQGWFLVQDSVRRTDTLPAVFYRTRFPASFLQQQQLYQYLKIRLAKDTVVMILR